MRIFSFLCLLPWIAACSGSDDAPETFDTGDSSLLDSTPSGDTSSPDDTSSSGAPTDVTGEATTYTVSVWADNWSSMYIDGTLVMEDSVPITTERSFNEEVFVVTATPPFQVAVELKDFKETDSGLEYIGEPNQQMGDGGYIAQFMAADGTVALVSDSTWRCMVTHEAPLNKECESSSDPDADCLFETTETPENWTEPDFDDSSWTMASTYTEAEVSPKEGFDRVDWAPSAELIWGDDLESVNTLLCRVTVE